MSFTWRFDPNDTFHSDYRPYVTVKRLKVSSWIAPEHQKAASGMRRDFLRNDRGQPIGTDKRLVLDARPSMIVPERKKIYLTIEDNSAQSLHR